MRLQKRSWVAFIVLLMFLIVQIILNLANPRLMSEILITDETSNQYLLTLNLPEQIWFGQSEKITIQLLNDISQNGLTIELQDPTDNGLRKIQNFEVDFVFSGADLTPPGVFITPIIKGNDLVMNWQIEPITNQDVTGTVWMYINTFSGGVENEIQRELIFTKNLSIEIKNIFGLKIGIIQGVLTFFTLLNIFYLFRSVKKRMPLKVSKN